MNGVVRLRGEAYHRRLIGRPQQQPAQAQHERWPPAGWPDRPGAPTRRDLEADAGDGGADRRAGRGGQDLAGDRCYGEGVH